MMSWSCPSHSCQLPLHVPVIFSVCPLHFPCMSRSFVASQFPSRTDWLPCPLFPFHSPCTPLVFISVPFMSLSVFLCFPFISRCFPVMLTSYFICLHFLAFPLCSPAFPAKKHGLSSVFAKRTSKNTEFFQIFTKRRKSRQGIRAWDPCLATPAPRRLRL